MGNTLTLRLTNSFPPCYPPQLFLGFGNGIVGWLYYIKGKSKLRNLNFNQNGETKMPAFLTKKEVFEWIRAGRKNVELRRGKIQNGDTITFLNGRNESLSGRILRKREGPLEDVLNAVNYKQIIPTAKNLDEAKVFIRRLYPTTEGTFTVYEFEINETKQK